MRQSITVLVGLISLLGYPAFANDDTSVIANSDPDKALKCRKVGVTGSLLKKTKVCKTVAQWKKTEENGNRAARAVVEASSKPTN